MGARDLPLVYVVALVALLGLGLLWILTWLGVPPFDNLQIFLLTNLLGLFAVVVLGVLGGAFVGLIAGHRILATREFSPFERAVVERLNEIREHQDALEKRLDALAAERDVRTRDSRGGK